MNPQKGKIDWCDYTWNPQTGCYGPKGDAENPQRCWYCSAYSFATRFRGGDFAIKFHPERLDELSEAQKPSRIFVVFNGDLWHPESDSDHIRQVLDATYLHPLNTYIFLTRHPGAYHGWSFPPRALLGITIDGAEPADEQARRIENLIEAQPATKVKRWISFEPLLGTIDERVLDLLPALDWVVVGALTGPRMGHARLDVESFLRVCRTARACKAPLFEKNNLELSYGAHHSKEFPKFRG